MDTDDTSQGTLKADDMVTEEGSSTESDAERIMKEAAALGARIPQSFQSQDSANTDPQCYCEKPRNFCIPEFQCVTCLKWFHESCISLPLGKCVPFMTNYTFICKGCNSTGTENFLRKQPNFAQMCTTAIANLIQNSRVDGTNRTLFSRDKEIIPFIEKSWECLTTVARRVKQTWHNTVHKTMSKETDYFICKERGPASEEFPMFGLFNSDLNRICPNYENRGAVSRALMQQDGRQNRGGAKRRFPDGQPAAPPGKRAKSDLVMPKLPPSGFPMEHPFNKDDFRYILAEPDPHAPFRQEFDDSVDWAGKPIPGWLYRKLESTSVMLALHDRAPQLKVTEDRFSVTGEKGYCMIRATHGVNYGSWYYEVTITDMPDNSATRIGWAQMCANLQTPLGYDKFGYSWRSRKGTKFHESKGYHFTDGGYGVGDVIGLYIELPKSTDSILVPSTHKDKPLVKFKSYLYYEEQEKAAHAVKKLKVLPGSKIVVYKNGKCMGTMFSDVYNGTYYPAISLYKSATVRVNFGPRFRNVPKDRKYRPMSECVECSMVAQSLSDLLYLVEHEADFKVDACYF